MSLTQYRRFDDWFYGIKNAISRNIRAAWKVSFESFEFRWIEATVKKSSCSQNKCAKSVYWNSRLIAIEKNCEHNDMQT